MLDDRYVDDSPMARALSSFGIQGTMARGQQAGEQVVQTIAQGGLKAAPGAAFQALIKALDEPREQVTRALGASPQAVDTFGGDVAQAAGAPRGLGEFGAAVLTDPTNYLGLGAGKLALRGGAKLGLQEANPFMRLTKSLHEADTLTSEAGAKAAGSLVSAIQGGLVPVNNKLGAMFPDLPKWTEFAMKSKAATEAVQYLEERHGLDFQKAQHFWQNGLTRNPSGVTGTIDDLYSLLPTGMHDSFSKDDLLNLMQGATAKNRTTFVEAEADYLKNLKDSMGLKTDSKFLKMYQDVTNWWKRQALGSIGYLSTNLKGGMLMNALEGTDPRAIARDVWDNKGAIWKGDQFDLKDAADLSAKTGMPIPKGLDIGAAASATANAGVNTAVPKLLDIGIGAGAGALGASATGEDPLTGALVGGVGGAALAPLTSKVRQVSQGLETAMRQRTYTQGMARELVDSLDAMEVVMRDSLNQARASGSIPNQVWGDLATKIARDSGGQFKVDDVMLMLQNSGKMRPEIADDMARKLDDIFYNASQKGTGASNAANFDYEDLSNIERVVKQFSPFATWTMKAIPQLTEKAGATPALANVPLQWNQEAEEQRKAAGLTSRVAGAMENPIGSTLLSSMLGRDVKAMQNPFAQFIPFADASRGMANLEYADSPGKAVTGILDIMGLGLNPILETGARVAGVMGTDAPAEGIPLRGAGVVNALTGVDLNEGTRRIESSVRENLTGKKPTDLNKTSVAKRLDELALRETGKAIGSGDPKVAAYIRAKAQQSGPLWDQAQKEVEAERNLGAVGGFIDPNLRAQALVTPEEEAIRGASTKVLLDQDVSKELQAIAKAKPKADAPTHLVKAVLDANDAVLKSTGKEMPPEVATRFRDPTNENIQWVAGQIFDWQAKQDPLLRGYKGSGSPEKREIQANQDAMNTAGQNITRAQVMAAKNKSPLTPAHKVVEQITTRERDALMAVSPQLTQYLAWKKLNPDGDVDAFLAQSH